MLNIGIIGAGRMGNAHASNLAKTDKVQLSAVYDINPEKSKAFAEKHPTAKILGSLEELVHSPDAEFIIITSPTYCHREALVAAMSTGKPIFCEKPLCRTREELNELAPLIRNYRNIFTIGFVRRYSPGCIMMKKLIDEGKLGKLRCGSVCCLFGGFKREWGDWFADYDKSGGVMLDMLAHHCDLQNFIIGKPISIYAQSYRLPKNAPQPYDYVSATAVFEGNYISNMECSWLRGGPSDTYITVYGEKGALKLSDKNGLSFFDIGGKESRIEVDEGITSPLQEEITGNMYANEIAYVIDCVINGKKTIVGAEDAINAMTFCLGMMESAETGKVFNF